MSSTIMNEVLKDLVTQYQRTIDPEVFEKILRRVDRLVYRVAHQLRRIPYYHYLRSENINDLYQTGVVGIYKAILKIPAGENPEKIPAWFVAYIKNEILTSFPRPHSVHLSQLEEVWIPAKEEDLVHENADVCLEGVFKKMLDDKVVTEEEVELLRLNKIRGLSMEAIGAMKGVCRDTIQSRIHRALARIQHRVRMLDLDPSDCIPS